MIPHYTSLDRGAAAAKAPMPHGMQFPRGRKNSAGKKRRCIKGGCFTPIISKGTWGTHLDAWQWQTTGAKWKRSKMSCLECLAIRPTLHLVNFNWIMKVGQHMEPLIQHPAACATPTSIVKSCQVMSSPDIQSFPYWRPQAPVQDVLPETCCTGLRQAPACGTNAACTSPFGPRGSRRHWTPRPAPPQRVLSHP